MRQKTTYFCSSPTVMPCYNTGISIQHLPGLFQLSGWFLVVYTYTQMPFIWNTVLKMWTMHSVLSPGQNPMSIPCWNPGWSSRYLFQTCLHKVSSAFERSQISQLIWVLYRYTLYLPLLQKSPVWKETEGYSEHNRQGKAKTRWLHQESRLPVYPPEHPVGHFQHLS